MRGKAYTPSQAGCEQEKERRGMNEQAVLWSTMFDAETITSPENEYGKRDVYCLKSKNGERDESKSKTRESAVFCLRLIREETMTIGQVSPVCV